MYKVLCTLGAEQGDDWSSVNSFIAWQAIPLSLLTWMASAAPPRHLTVSK